MNKYKVEATLVIEAESELIAFRDAALTMLKVYTKESGKKVSGEYDINVIESSFDINKIE
jgi:hypothetical protein